MNKIKLSNLKEFFITLIVSFLIILAIAFVVELELLFRLEKQVNFEELNVENLAKFCTIEELEKQLLKTPDDIILNIRLAKAYESIDKLDKANDFYKNALKLSSRSNFSLYSYAMFCAKNNMYVFAATLAEELNGNSRKVNFYKAKIYETIADGFSKSKDYPASVKSYQISYKYANSISDSKYFAQIRKKYSDEYVKLADFNMHINETKEAISNLENSIKINKNALANYKLGLIYLHNKPRLAEKYINEAFFDDPYIVNPYVYNSLLQDILLETKVLKQENLANYYNSRLSRFKKKILQTYLYKDELTIENSALVNKKTYFGDSFRYLVFDLKNNTSEDIDSLYMKAELYINGEKYPFEKKIINPQRKLEAYDTLLYQDWKLPNDLKFNNLAQNNDIFVRYFAKKRPQAPWILVKIDFLKI